jgi:hypothetical protein
MNPLASSKCVTRVLMALAAISGIFLTAGCGSGGGPILSIGGGFSNSSLKGQYVISQTGIGINQALTSNDPFSETIVFTADGGGHLTIPVDDFDQDGTPYGLTSSLTGTYSIASDGTGSLFFNSSNYAITMIDDSHFYVIEQDTFATASGFGEKQDTTAFTAAPSGTFVFKAHNLQRSSRVGGITITSGAISGTEDLLNLGALSSIEAITSSVAMTAPDSTGRGTFTLSGGTSFGYYVVNASKFHIMSSSGTLEIGQAEAQTGGPFSVATLAAGASYVFGSSGDTSVGGTAGIHSAGVFTTDGAGNIEAGSSTVPGAVDYVQDLTVNSNLAVSGGTYTLDASGNGNGTINLALSGGTISPQIFWMVNGSRAYFLANNTAAVEDGTFSQQTGGPFTALTSQAAFVMDGFDVTYKDRVGAFKPTATSFNWNQAANSFDPTVSNGGLPSAIGTNGTYQVSSNGRATVVVNGVTASGVNPGVVFYLSSANSGFMVQEDIVGYDIGGAFSQQASQ